jgi:hypothetical protein
MPKALEITGMRFGRLSVIERAENNAHHQTMWRCICDCGNEVIIRGINLTSGNTTSCGCYHSERVIESHSKHGYSNGKLYNVWRSIKDRCNNIRSKAWKYYGGRGIKVCEEWNQPEAFIEWAVTNGYKDGLTIDRIDNNKGYEPSNCRWVDMKTQNRNHRQRENKTGFRGVYKSKNGKYTSMIAINQKYRYIGIFDTAEQAAEAYQRAKEERDKKQG